MDCVEVEFFGRLYAWGASSVPLPPSPLSALGTILAGAAPPPEGLIYFQPQSIAAQETNPYRSVSLWYPKATQKQIAKLDPYMMTMYKGKRRNHRCKFAALSRSWNADVARCKLRVSIRGRDALFLKG